MAQDAHADAEALVAVRKVDGAVQRVHAPTAKGRALGEVLRLRSGWTGALHAAATAAVASRHKTPVGGPAGARVGACACWSICGPSPLAWRKGREGLVPKDATPHRPRPLVQGPGPTMRHCQWPRSPEVVAANVTSHASLLAQYCVPRERFQDGRHDCSFGSLVGFRDDVGALLSRYVAGFIHRRHDDLITQGATSHRPVSVQCPPGCCDLHAVRDGKGGCGICCPTPPPLVRAGRPHTPHFGSGEM